MDHYWTVQGSSSPSSAPRHHKSSSSSLDESASVATAPCSKWQTPEVTPTPARTSSSPRRKSSADLSRGVSTSAEAKNSKVTACIPDSTQPPTTHIHHHPHHHHQPSTKRSRMNGSRRWPYYSNERSTHQKIQNIEDGKDFHHQADYHHDRLILLPPPVVQHSSLYSGFEGHPVCPGAGSWRTAERGLGTVVPMGHLEDLFAHPTMLPLFPGDAPPPHNGRLPLPHPLIIESRERQEPENVSN